MTNAHVVWPFDAVRVVFPDGSEYPEALVANWDLMGDLAVLGPLTTTVGPVNLVDREELVIGSQLYLIGYPAEEEPFPQPTITQGILSRLRQWEPIDMTYFQTDAASAGGQSGGVLVAESGEVIGISGFSFSEAGFGLVASAADVNPRVKALIDGENVAGLGDRSVPLIGGRLKHESTLLNLWDQHFYVINQVIGTRIDLRVESEGDALLAVADVFGDLLIFADDSHTGVESASATTELSGPYFVGVVQSNEESSDFSVTSSHALIPYDDPDDGITVSVGQTVAGNMDFPFDNDYFLIDLEEGQIIEMVVDSMNIDGVVAVDFLGAAEEQLVTDDDSGGGIFGINAKLIYRAPHTGSFFIVVNDADFAEIGGYFLRVTNAPPGAIPAVIARPPEAFDSPFGPMLLYQSDDYPFAIQYPETWAEQPVAPEVATFLLRSEEGYNFVVVEEDLFGLGLGKLTLGEYVDVVLAVVESQDSSFELVSREPIATVQGLPAELITFSTFGGFVGQRLIYLHEGQTGFSATYTTPAARFQELQPLIEHSLGSFLIGATVTLSR